MAAQPTFSQRLALVVSPTRTQILITLFLSLVILVPTQSNSLLHRFGITQAGLNISGAQFHDRFDGVLRSPVAGQMALITFWATVGLVAYLVCWAVYNLLIELRNEMTIEALYTNRGGHNAHSPAVSLIIKAVAAIGLGLILASLWYGISFWIALGAMAAPLESLVDIMAVLAAFVGLAVQLYALLVFIQLTFTPWYRAQTFTGA